MRLMPETDPRTAGGWSKAGTCEPMMSSMPPCRGLKMIVLYPSSLQMDSLRSHRSAPFRSFAVSLWPSRHKGLRTPRSRLSRGALPFSKRGMNRPAIALYQPDIPGNTGTILRLGACLGLPVHVIGPAGFDLSDRALRRAGMDYLAIASLTQHVSWAAFETWRASESRRLVLATTRATTAYTDFDFLPCDIVLFGRESAGVPDHVHDGADQRVTIPMRAAARSINLALSVAMMSGEIVRRFGVGDAPARA